MGKSSAAIVVIVVGFILLVIAVGGHYCCLSTFIGCLFGPTDDPACLQRQAAQTATPKPTGTYQFGGNGSGGISFTIPPIHLPGGIGDIGIFNVKQQ